MSNNDIFRTQIILSNPYKLIEKDLLVYALTTEVNVGRKFPFRQIRPLRVLLRILKYWASLYGFKKLSRGEHSYLKATTQNGKIFRIRNTNAQFGSIYSKTPRHIYEPDVSASIKLFLPEGGVFVDIGSNWGHHSINTVLTKNAHAILFEPNPLVADDVQRIINDLGLKNSLEIYNIGLSDRNGKFELIQNFFESGVASINPEFSNQISSNEKLLTYLFRKMNYTPLRYLVDVRPLDSFLLDRVDLIKIDAEGVELEILCGGKNLINRTKPGVIFEFHSGDISKFQAYRDFFGKLDYEIYLINCTKENREKNIFDFRLTRFDDLTLHTQYNLIALPKNYKFSLPQVLNY